jgi:Domain of unknown function (DUF397)
MVERKHREAKPELVWRKSSASGDSGCFEIAFVDHAVLVRDSKNRASATLTIARDEWAEFLRRISH